ncbi:hypothetical protein ScPMuIL_018186 [Solemya velum]
MISEKFGFVAEFFRSEKPNNVVHTQKEKTSDIARDSGTICNDYIFRKVWDYGLDPSLLEFEESELEVSCEIYFAGQTLEKMYPKVYYGIPRKLGMSVESKKDINIILTELLLKLFSDGVTWAKLLSMFAIAGSFAVECVRKGYPEHVGVVTRSIENFVVLHVTDWLVGKGGWEAFHDVVNERQDRTMMIAFFVFIFLTWLVIKLSVV